MGMRWLGKEHWISTEHAVFNYRTFQSKSSNLQSSPTSPAHSNRVQPVQPQFSQFKYKEVKIKLGWAEGVAYVRVSVNWYSGDNVLDELSGLGQQIVDQLYQMMLGVGLPNHRRLATSPF